MSVSMKFVVMGAGGVGGYFGGRLAEAGEEVLLVARGAHLKAIRGEGLRVSSLAGDFHIHPARAGEDPSGVGAAEAVLVSVKSWQTEDATRALRPVV